MKVKECMCEDICKCKTNNKVSDIAKIMNKNNVGCVPVCDEDDCVVGILTDRDIILRSIACGRNACDINASEIMTRNVKCCDCNDEIDTVTKNMGQSGIRRIPVTENGKIVGILTLGDLAKHQNVSCECVGKTFEHICNCNNNEK